MPAIQAWQAHHREVFGTEILDVPARHVGENYPNVAQARYLIEAGVPEPLIATLTRIGTVEGFGANIRLLKPGNLQPRFDDDIRGTALDHLGKGLFEAHGRDEAGFEDEAGHEDMWFAARDIAFERPPRRSTCRRCSSASASGRTARVGGAADRLLPDDVSANVEAMAMLMVRVLLIEISAFRTFAWAEAWMSDVDLVAGDGEAADLVSYIRADETPHIAYLATALTEMRDRTWIGESGKRYPGTEMVGTLLDGAARPPSAPTGTRDPGRHPPRDRALVRPAPERRRDPRGLPRPRHRGPSPPPDPTSTGRGVDSAASVRRPVGPSSPSAVDRPPAGQLVDDVHAGSMPSAR